VLDHLRRLPRGRWYYRRPATTAAVATVAVTSTLVGRALLPRCWRPSGIFPLAVASAGAYVAVRLGSVSGVSKYFKHTYLDWFGGDVDDAQTWMLGMLGGGSVLVAWQKVRRIVGAGEV
jgi:hypothetical protein